MISIQLAQELKNAGLRWTPALHDFFAVPDRGFDDRAFVISDLLANIENVLGSTVVAFQGAPEWALDYLVSSEAVWLPTEAQLRQAVEEQLMKDQRPALVFTWNMAAYRCEFTYRGRPFSFESPNPSDAYGKALLYMLGQGDR